MKRRVPVFLKRTAYPLYHRICNRSTLTVVMFHRVMPRDDPRWDNGNARWTVTDGYFRECLRLFKRHYNVITLDDVLASRRGERPLPSRSLLITFDDGYADNAEFALPLLQEQNLPAVLFVFTDAVNSKMRLWALDLRTAYFHGDCSLAEVASIYRALFPDREGSPLPTDQSMLGAITFRGPELTATEEDALLSHLRTALPRVTTPPQMLTAEQLRYLCANRVAIAAHGKTHVAFTYARDLDRELNDPRSELATVLSLDNPEDITSVAFPYGLFDNTVAERASCAGYELMFTTEPRVMVIEKGWLTTPVVSRLAVIEPQESIGEHIDDLKLAYGFFRAPHVHRPQSSPT